MTITEIVAKKLRLFSRRRVVNILDGNYDSIFKGKGLEFNSLRNYIQGDEVKDIDWRATARSKDVQTRLYSPLRDHRIVVVADTSPSMLISGYSSLNKRDALFGLTTVLGFFVKKNRDLLAICAAKPDGTAVISKFSNSSNHLEQLLRTLDDSIQKTPPQNSLSIEVLLKHILKNLRHRAAIFIVSDSFQDPLMLKNILKKLQIKHQIYYLQLAPSSPFSQSSVEQMALVDIENNNSWQNELTTNAALKREWGEMLRTYLSNIAAICKSTGTSYGYVDSAEQVPDEIRKLFIQAKRYAKRH